MMKKYNFKQKFLFWPQTASTFSYIKYISRKLPIWSVTSTFFMCSFLESTPSSV